MEDNRLCTVELTIEGKLVSVAGYPWLDKLNIVMSPAYVATYGKRGGSALGQIRTYLSTIRFAPFQNIADPRYETAVLLARQTLVDFITEVTIGFQKSLIDNPNTDAWVCSHNSDEFNIEVTVKVIN